MLVEDPQEEENQPEPEETKVQEVQLPEEFKVSRVMSRRWRKYRWCLPMKIVSLTSRSCGDSSGEGRGGRKQGLHDR